MASLRIQGAGKMLRSATTARVSLPLAARRFQSAVTTTNTVPSVNQPDYDAPADKATSYAQKPPTAQLRAFGLTQLLVLSLPCRRQFKMGARTSSPQPSFLAPQWSSRPGLSGVYQRRP